MSHRYCIYKDGCVLARTFAGPLVVVQLKPRVALAGVASLLVDTLLGAASIVIGTLVHICDTERVSLLQLYASYQSERGSDICS
jgi:hypothetical protein